MWQGNRAVFFSSSLSRVFFRVLVTRVLVLKDVVAGVGPLLVGIQCSSRIAMGWVELG